MNIKSPSARFEQELRGIIRRGTKSKEHDEQVTEVCGHFADLFQEALSQGLSVSQSEREARQRLGTPSRIALQMLANPSRISKGLKMQRVAMWGFVGAMFANQVISYCALRQWQGVPLTIFAVVCVALFLCLGPIWGVGILWAGKVSWKAAIAIWPIAMGIMAVSTYFLMPLYASYRPIGTTTGHVFLSPQFYLSYAFETSTRFMVFFVSLAVIAFSISRIRLLGMSWFRLERA